MRNITGFLQLFSLIDLPIFIFVTVLQLVTMEYIILKLFDVAFTVNKLVSTSIFFSVIVLLVRKIYLFNKWPFGSHSLVLAILFAVFMALLFKLSIIKAFIGSSFNFALIYLAAPMVFFTIKLFNVDITILGKDFILTVIFGSIESLYLFIVAVILYFSKFNIYKIISR